MKHVAWRLEDVFLRSSADFAIAVPALQILFGMFNHKHEAAAHEAVAAAADVVEDSPATAMDALTKFSSGAFVKLSLAIARETVKAFLDNRLVRPSDGKLPPRCVVHLMLRRGGFERLTGNLYPTGPTAEAFREQLQLFDDWSIRMYMNLT